MVLVAKMYFFFNTSVIQRSPSMLSSDFSNLASEAQRMIDCGADYLHMDIMGLNITTLYDHRWVSSIKMV